MALWTVGDEGEVRAEELLECWFEHLLGRLGVVDALVQGRDSPRRWRDAGGEDHIDEQSELPVFVVYPEWSTVAGLARAVIADVVINVPSMRCPGCQDAEDRRQRELSDAQEWAQSMLRGVHAGAAEPEGSARPNVRRWQYDKFGREMYPRVWRRVLQNAAILQRLGFVQSNEKPWLFRHRLPKGCGVVFANFGSTEEIALWEDPSALVHWQLKERSGAEEHALIQQLLQTCRAAGVEVRVSFYNREFDQ